MLLCTLNFYKPRPSSYDPTKAIWESNGYHTFDANTRKEANSLAEEFLRQGIPIGDQLFCPIGIRLNIGEKDPVHKKVPPSRPEDMYIL